MVNPGGGGEGEGLGAPAAMYAIAGDGNGVDFSNPLDPRAMTDPAVGSDA